MSTESRIPVGGNAQHCEAVLRISEAVSPCREPEELAKTFADRLGEFVPFDHLDIVVFKENSGEIELHVWGKGLLPQPDVPMEELPGWHIYDSQQALLVPDWATDEGFPRLKQLVAAMGVDLGTVVLVPLTTPPLGALGIASRVGAT